MRDPLIPAEEERQAQALFHKLRARQGGQQLTLWEQPKVEPAEASPVDLADLFGREYQVILADPPWQYRNTGLNGAAVRHYSTLSTPEICRLPEQIGLQCSPNSVLFLWATNPMLEEALTVIRAWGFAYKAKVVWVKDRLGTGFYVRSMTEDLLIATRGSFTPTARRVRPAISSLIVAPTREHSRKPEEAYTLIERLYPGTDKIELFARHRRAGWAAWGDQLGMD